MPNLCNTTYKCIGELKEVESLHSLLERMSEQKTTFVENDFGKWWLGNLIHLIGGKWQGYRCRGEITDYLIEDNVLTIHQNTAWCEQEGVRKIIEEKYPSIKVYYLEEELGCGLYHTNDIHSLFFDESFLVDSYESFEYFQTIEELASYVENITKAKVKRDFDACKKALEDYANKTNNDDVYFDVYELSRKD